MSFAPIFQTLRSKSAVTTVFGSNPVRVFPQGAAPEGVSRPYAVFQQITGSPENYLNQRPDADDSTTQVDVYADTVDVARSAAIVIRDSVEGVSYVSAVREMGRDPDTNLYRVSVDIDWITHRT